MWSTATRSMGISGSVRAVRSGMAPQELGGAAVDVYRFNRDDMGEYQFVRLNALPALTDAVGAFQFSELPVTVQVQTVIPGSPPYLPVEIVQPESLPDLLFRISAPAGTMFVDIYDEREVVDAGWEAAHPERAYVPLSGSAPFEVLVPDYATSAAVPGKEFHFLRVGRAIRDEIGELGESRADHVDYQGKPGYMLSSDARTVNMQPSFFGGQVDAPFGSTLQIGGHFGAGYLAAPLVDELYYTASFSTYSGDPALPYNAALLAATTSIQDPLFNKRYILPTPLLPHGRWETLSLGPFAGTITGVEAPHSPALVGTAVQVYKRPGLPNLATEYWPFWDLVLIWNSSAAPQGLVILTLEAYQRTGGTDSNPELTKLAMDPSINAHLPLHVDNYPPVPKYLVFEPAIDTQAKFFTGDAHFVGVAESVSGDAPMNVCNEMPVGVGDIHGNDCILARYSIEDGAGNAHQHVHRYSLRAEYTPKTGTVVLADALGLDLKDGFAGFQDIAMTYTPSLPPTMEVDNFQSVIVPETLDGWPPQPNGDIFNGLPCPQYAVEVSLGCTVRTVNGWSRLFGWRHVSRHLIIKRV